MHKNIGTENVKVWDQVEDQNLADRIILKCNVKKYRVRTETAFIRNSTGRSNALLSTWWWAVQSGKTSPHMKEYHSALTITTWGRMEQNTFEKRVCIFYRYNLLGIILFFFLQFLLKIRFCTMNYFKEQLQIQL